MVDLDDPASEAAAVDWWERLVAGGGEGMVVKPLDADRHRRRAASCSRASSAAGRSTCASSTGPSTAARPTSNGCASAASGRKRSLAQREFALGIEALERFVAGEPLHRVHECVFGVLALESEPVDPRL